MVKFGHFFLGTLNSFDDLENYVMTIVFLFLGKVAVWLFAVLFIGGTWAVLMDTLIYRVNLPIWLEYTLKIVLTVGMLAAACFSIYWIITA